jgi:competence protein ComEC
MSASPDTAWPTGRRPGVSWRLMVSIRRAYGGAPAVLRHPLPGSALAGLVIVVGLACRRDEWRPLTILIGVVVGVLGGVRDRWRWRVIVVVLIVGAAAGVRADHEWKAAEPRSLSPFTGWVTLVSDPQPVHSATRAIVEVDGERFELWARSRAKQQRAARWRAGDRLRVAGVRQALDADRADRVAWQHVVGEFELEWVGDTAQGSPLARASNRVRSTLESGARAALSDNEAALFRGLVVGDDRDQPPEMVDRFRDSGLSHLTAVSGQNVAFVLAAAGPLLRRLRPSVRWMATIALIGWFVALTRFEPSIMRAGAMAMLSATAFALGRERGPARLLCLAVIGLLLVDPLLVGSVGFWLSVGATAGVTTVGPWLSARLVVLGPLATPVGVTLGAQVGVLAPAALVFGGVPLVSVPANLLAVPVAGGVMLYGLPAGLLAGLVPSSAPVVMLPCRLGVRWIDVVAALGAETEPGRTGSVIGWLLLSAGVGAVAVGNRGRQPRAV